MASSPQHQGLPSCQSMLSSFLLRVVRDAILVVNHERVVYANKAFEDLTHFSTWHLVKSSYILFSRRQEHDHFFRFAREHMDSIATRNGVLVECVNQNSGVFLANVTFHPFSDEVEGEVRCACVFSNPLLTESFLETCPSLTFVVTPVFASNPNSSFSSPTASTGSSSSARSVSSPIISRAAIPSVLPSRVPGSSPSLGSSRSASSSASFSSSSSSSDDILETGVRDPEDSSTVWRKRKLLAEQLDSSAKTPYNKRRARLKRRRGLQAGISSSEEETLEDEELVQETSEPKDDCMVLRVNSAAIRLLRRDSPGDLVGKKAIADLGFQLPETLLQYFRETVASPSPLRHGSFAPPPGKEYQLKRLKLTLPATGPLRSSSSLHSTPSPTIPSLSQVSSETVGEAIISSSSAPEAPASTAADASHRLVTSWSSSDHSTGKGSVRSQTPPPDDGSDTIWLSATFAPLGYAIDGKMLFLMIAEDVSLLKSLEDRLEESQISAASQKLFFAKMTHDLRTPLSSMLGIAALIEQTPLNPDQKELLHTFRMCGDTLMNLVNNLLDLSSFESNRITLDSEEIALLPMVEDVLEVIAPHARFKSLELFYVIDPGVPNIILGDSLRIKQVLGNLLSNAVKFTEKGEVVVRISVTNVQNDSHQLEFTVEDTGVGIPESVKGKLFQAYYQGDRKVQRRYGGTGLGLSICHSLVELMGGRLWFTSQERVGSRFCFSFPQPHIPYGQPMRGMAPSSSLSSLSSSATSNPTTPVITTSETTASTATSTLEGATPPTQRLFSEWNQGAQTQRGSVSMGSRHPALDGRRISVASTRQSLAHAIYSQLQQLGCNPERDFRFPEAIIVDADTVNSLSSPPLPALAISATSSSMANASSVSFPEPPPTPTSLASRDTHATSEEHVAADLTIPHRSTSTSNSPQPRSIFHHLSSVPIVHVGWEKPVDAQHFVRKPIRLRNLQTALLDAFEIVESSIPPSSSSAQPTSLVPPTPFSPVTPVVPTTVSTPLSTSMFPMAVGVRVLLVDDNILCRKVAQRMLEAFGFQPAFIQTASSGEEAIVNLKQQMADVVLMDLEMPVMNGFEATRLIRTIWGPHYPRVIALSASSDPQERARCRAVGMDGFLVKPLDREAVRNELLAIRPRDRYDPQR